MDGTAQNCRVVSKNALQSTACGFGHDGRLQGLEQDDEREEPLIRLSSSVLKNNQSKRVLVHPFPKQQDNCGEHEGLHARCVVDVHDVCLNVLCHENGDDKEQALDPLCNHMSIPSIE